jgi:tetratricopeptide (TPR) repeat protein
MRQAIGMGASAPENVAWCLADLGQMLFKTGALDDAERAYRDALALFPGYHHALAGIGRVLAAREQFKEALEAFRKAQSNAPLPEYAGWLARLYRRLGNEELARKQLAMLDAVDALGKAAGEVANRNLALAFVDLDYKTSRALDLARAELAIRRDVYTYDALSWALFKSGQYAEAASAMEKALSQNTPEPSFHEHASRIFEALGRREDAQRHRLQSSLPAIAERR